MLPSLKTYDMHNILEDFKHSIRMYADWWQSNGKTGSSVLLWHFVGVH